MSLKRTQSASRKLKYASDCLRYLNKGMGTHLMYRLRNATPEDAPFLESLFIETHRDELAPAGLDETQLMGLLRMQARGQRMSYSKDYPRAKDQIVLDDAGEPIGRFFVDTAGDHIHLLDIALQAGLRGRGIGTKLIGELTTLARSTDASVRLSVSPQNRAFHLYKRLGFEVVSSGVQLEMEYKPGSVSTINVIPASIVEETLPGSEWEALVGTSFAINLKSDERLPTLLLSSFKRSRHSSSSFTLTFHGPMDALLLQGAFPLKLKAEEPHGEVPAEWPIFLVPIGPEGEVMQYEAVFNL
jgi:ribosomal protein S18 acetylase RimI-like enzyme